MFDLAYYFPFQASDPELIDHETLETRLGRLSDAELSALEDDLDFCSFTGVPSVRILDVLDLVTTLDTDWQRLRVSRTSPSVPAAF